MKIHQALKIGTLAFILSIAAIKIMQVAFFGQGDSLGREQGLLSGTQTVSAYPTIREAERCSAHSACVEFSVPGVDQALCRLTATVHVIK